MARPRSWRDVPVGPVRGARYVPGGLGSWRSVARDLRPATSSRSSGGGKRGQANDLERQIAAQALENDDDGGLFNMGGRGLLKALDALDTPGAFVRSGFKELADSQSVSGGASWRDFVDQGWDNISGSDVLFPEGDVREPSSVAEKLAKAGVGFAFDIATDPLTFVTGGGAKVGAEAGESAASKLLSKEAVEQFGEAAVRQTERAGGTFANAEARRAAVTAQGTTIAQREAQKALKFKANQMLSPQAREVIGATPGTYAKIPGAKHLKIDKVIEKIAPGRVVPGRRGQNVFRLSKREVGLGKLGGRARARVTQSGVGNRVAELFTKYPDLRTKMLFGSPEEAATSFMSLQSRTAGDLQKRLFAAKWGSQMSDLLSRAKKAGVDGTDLRYAAAESLDEGVGEATQRVMAAALKKGDDTLVDDVKKFFNDIVDAANEIDPELPWLMKRGKGTYTVNLPSDEMIAFRGGRGNAGGALNKDVFDHRQMYGTDPGQINELFGVELKAGDTKSVRQQIDEILADKGLPNWFETDAFKAFPDYVNRTASRYGDEFMAKRLRDLGIAEPSFIKDLTEMGHKQGRINAAVYAVLTKAQIRADRAGLAARQAQRTADAGIEGVQSGRRMVKRASEGKAEIQAERDTLTSMAQALDPEPLREFATELQEDAAILGTKREALLANIADAEDAVFGLEHAVVEQSHALQMETYAAYSRVTKLEKKLSGLYDELGDNYERMRLMAGGTDYSAARKAVDKQLEAAQARAERIMANESRFGPDAFDNVVADVQRLENLKKDPAALKAWADKQKNLGKFQSELMIAEDARKVMVATEAEITRVMSEIHDIEVLLHDFEDVAMLPTAQLEQQIARVDSTLAELIPRYDAGETDLANKITALGNAKSSALHELDTIHRAQKRIAVADEGAPQLLEQLDKLHNTESMGDDIIHTLFPDLPPEVSGRRVRAYFDDRHTELLEQIDTTNGQILSAHADANTMRAELSGTLAEKRQAEANLKKVSQEVTQQDRDIWTQQQELLSQAETALNRAIEIDDELEMARAQWGEFSDQLKTMEAAEKIAEHYLSVMQARQLRYEATALAAERTAKEAKRTEEVWRKIAKAEFSKPIEEALQPALKASFKEIGSVSQTQHAWLVEGLRAATIMQGPKGLRPALKVFDKVQTLWKAYALSTPGTVNRNLMGGVYNNYLADIGVTARDYDVVARVVFKDARTMRARPGNKLNDADQAIMDQIAEAGILTGSATTLEIERSIGAANYNPFSTDNKGVRFFRKGQENVEELVRGTLAYRVIKNGGTTDEAISQVMKFHFDYDDISAFERSVLRRAVPFYTWTRKNFPLMLEQIVQKPTKFSRFYQLKNEIESQSDEEGLIPSYFTENMAIRMPFTMGGSQSYLMPDLPFLAVNDMTDPTMAFSQMSPFIKTPVEYAFGKQFFKGIPLRDEYTPVPRTMQGIPGLMEGLGAIGLAERGAEGWYMKQKDLYVGEQMLPVLGRSRRLFPSESEFDARVLSSWISTFGGVGMRANTPQERRNAAYARVDSAMERYDTYAELGTFSEDTKMPRFGQTVNAAYEQLGVEHDDR